MELMSTAASHATTRIMVVVRAMWNREKKVSNDDKDGQGKESEQEGEEGELVCVASLGRVSAGSQPVLWMLVACLVGACVSPVSLRSLGEGSSSGATTIHMVVSCQSLWLSSMSLVQ